METKKQLRKMMKEQLLSLDPAIHKRKSGDIAQQLFSLPVWKNAKHIGITVSRGFEVDTKQIIQKAWDDEKKVSVPKCSTVSERLMDFHRITSFQELENVYMDLYEPIIGMTELTPAEDMDLMVVPGLIFNPDGYRIGFGGGFYDRYLAGYHGTTVSLAFDFQYMNSIPVESFDVPVEWIITDKGVKKDGK
ncbi:5-formyltetrahydrofolate cyclo-ligase [Fictibacillus solisalsi]|uniref:5-formyltetrahydrofolate cyclo-ligase n=1 Tax=Fictibacillus solisalsi TaxID=459525 RepID=A0A1G9WBS7_9BACL|nr:5-formyltetrahydrofolate cyclo-ligase [Fictibacillus solisalsi]SDM81671.1 5-formyltetrahydrofolate cyclo-ligase [Fictibacillus solisalsi]